ncbi:MAG: tetratricopeptide repeat protein [Beduini sp.]|uniref:tetratricopeptide repeat protein n=1 Tax=Beduini sp. TaxID=1922300 RepID=UPI0039A1EF3F
MEKFNLNERRLVTFKRKELGLTVGQVADELHMSKSNLSRIENGKIMVSEDNRELLETRFSINFSLEDKYYYLTLEKLNKVTELLIFYKLFDEYSRNQVDNANQYVLQSVAYPVHILLRLLVYSVKYMEWKFVTKYIAIFNSIIDLLEPSLQKIFYISKISFLYFNKDYNKSLSLCMYVEENYNPEPLLDSYIYHVKSMIYICLGDQDLTVRSINRAIELSTSIGNSPRLVALNILKGNSLRLRGKYKEALVENNKNLEYANTNHIHIYDYTLLKNRGWTYYLLNNYESALKYYQEAEKIGLDDDICFIAGLCSYRLGLRKQCKDYIIKGRKTKNAGIAFPYLIDWLELTLNKRYSIKAENKLLYCLKKMGNKMHIDSRNNICRLLIEHYTFHNDFDKVKEFESKLKYMDTDD